jgi:hypothetical protein
MSYEKKLERSRTIADVQAVLDVMKAAQGIPLIADASMKVPDMDSGMLMCEVWWDGENEVWFADFSFEDDDASGS